MKEAGGAAQRDFVEMIAQVGDGAEAGVIHQIGADVIAEALEQGGRHERKGHDVQALWMEEMRRQNPEVEMPRFVAEADNDGALGRIGP